MTVVSYLEINPKSVVMVSDGQGTWNSDAKCYITPKIYKTTDNCLIGLTGHEHTTKLVIDETKSFLSESIKVNDIIDKVYTDQKEKYFEQWVQKRALKKGKRLTRDYKQKSRKKFEKDDEPCAYLICIEYDKEKDRICKRYISNEVPRNESQYFSIGCGEDPAIRSVSQSLNRMLRDEFENITLSDAVRILLKATMFSEGSGVGGEPQVYVLDHHGAEKLTSCQTMLLYRTLKFEEHEALEKCFVKEVFEKVVDKKEDIAAVSDYVWDNISESKKQEIMLLRHL